MGGGHILVSPRRVFLLPIFSLSLSLSLPPPIGCLFPPSLSPSPAPLPTFLVYASPSLTLYLSLTPYLHFLLLLSLFPRFLSGSLLSICFLIISTVNFLQQIAAQIDSVIIDHTVFSPGRVIRVCLGLLLWCTQVSFQAPSVRWPSFLSGIVRTSKPLLLPLAHRLYLSLFLSVLGFSSLSVLLIIATLFT